MLSRIKLWLVSFLAPQINGIITQRILAYHERQQEIGNIGPNDELTKAWK